MIPKKCNPEIHRSNDSWFAETGEKYFVSCENHREEGRAKTLHEALELRDNPSRFCRESEQEDTDVETEFKPYWIIINKETEIPVRAFGDRPRRFNTVEEAEQAVDFLEENTSGDYTGVFLIVKVGGIYDEAD